MLSLGYQLALSDLFVQLLSEDVPEGFTSKGLSETFLQPESGEDDIGKLFDRVYEIEGVNFITAVQIDEFNRSQKMGLIDFITIWHLLSRIKLEEIPFAHIPVPILVKHVEYD